MSLGLLNQFLALIRLYHQYIYGQFLNQAWRLAHAWFIEIVFVHEVGMLVCVSTLEAINYIHVIFNLYNQLNKFVVFRNVTNRSMHGRDFCNEARCDRNQSNKAIL